jgi:hypothetical protein
MATLRTPNPTIVDRLRERTTYVPSSEVMQILNCSRKSLCLWINSGKLPALRTGKNNMVDPNTLADYLSARRVT